ncbi:uncharacterized protein LOC125241233 [Leguminivora glycinivorella]|uniref:uncharacterized protein LOC125241233 n=1 Tax=Leguminivora glycinivorella TaxID=1035111 RepID=UPI00200D2F98|nr:uncharacterized protein LOC125241233 [Leguminivora glycinivorella]
MWRLIPMLLLAAVTLSTGVLLPRLPPLQPGPDPAADSPIDTHSTLTECDVLRRLFNSEANWMFDTDNKQYNDYVTKGAANLHHDNYKDTYQLQPQALDQNYLHEQNPDEEPLHYELPLPTIKTLYLRNKDVIIRDDQAYYMYDTYMATTSPFDYVQNHQNCLYKAMARPSSHDLDTSILEWPAEQKLNTQEVMPLVEQVGKRFDSEETGEKEIPDMVLNAGETGEVQKKLFSFWSRLQALSHKGRQLPTRRHTFAFYGPDDTRDGPLTAETRASHLRPPGQPLRWG